MAVSRTVSFVWVVGVYLVAGLAAVGAGALLADFHPLLVAFVADAVATAVVFGFSVLRKNASLYDPYWSVAPVAIALYLLAVPLAEAPNPVRPILVVTLVLFWAIRLTANWATGWEGLHHVDWRYVDLQAKSGAAWPAVNFLGIHLFPTILVYLGCLSLWPALRSPVPLGWLDLLAAVVTAASVVVEMVADLQRRWFAAKNSGTDRVLDVGLWAWTRHPNYLGEVGFWLGLFLFALAGGWEHGWTVVGPAAMLALFLGISIPMMEKRQVARKPSYAEYQRRVPMFFPFFRR